ncbi:MAG TPA: hypothetical protein VFQ23_04205 [Anaerolineales bacterium]|nr:hypothetical protein [Anaerolineales bacterium]
MSNQARADKERYERQLNHYRSLMKVNKRDLDGKPFLAVQIDFWLESIRFLITELEIWDYMGKTAKYYETINKIHKALNRVHRLILYLDEGDAKDDGPEI